MKRRICVTRRDKGSLSLEQLESRVVLDGNVHAFVRGGSLHLDGDSRNNEITIEQSAARSFTVTSRDGTTTINGQAGPLTFNGVRKNLFIALKGGNDVVDLAGTSGSALAIRGRLFADLGSGDDQLLMENVHVRGMTINMGTGADLL